MCRIVTYNIHSGIGRDKKHDYKRIGQFLANSGADVVLLQEMDTRPSERNTAQDVKDICAENTFKLIPSPAIRESDGWYGNAILTRFDVLAHDTLDVSQNGRQPRNVQIVELKTEKTPLTVVNTHKGLKKLERRSQFSLLHEHLSSRMKEKQIPLVLAGDFNEWQFFSKAFKALNDLLLQQKVGATFPSHFPVFALDRVWVSDDIKVKACRKLKNAKTRILSDHLPVLVDIELPQND
ncbi:endonuclease/exonuclease/phosphatase family protein [Alteromonas macleodii]|jgi:endonuclease/exonuclease/phosphatase family metal-dependent hydrolase|uniref:endonuclease/exonuclease/phosphatase family protein n=1 Tax=Alteromonas macleodii TaxID=28108 RepID=UPI00127A2498|nr:endonuclease/exonuclease/phosphatase family protein [Alteromonas macleodii]CAI2391325.1 Metal-dependent hydrolase [Alteromonas macleodii]CAI3966052.1 Metal-dependent hydrolase [Alteromonas macleodii]CAI3966436.1 Metal-dependent hydrolase [Alteromonas macleodii]CAI3966440.1 Metal-dependent hydrolase [Alteromonas macleodii]VTO40922.1 Metal-dependent hydrolase [Alteromonas macleodii]